MVNLTDLYDYMSKNQKLMRSNKAVLEINPYEEFNEEIK